jgi:hypothetical protein
MSHEQCVPTIGWVLITPPIIIAVAARPSRQGSSDARDQTTDQVGAATSTPRMP